MVDLADFVSWQTFGRLGRIRRAWELEVANSDSKANLRRRVAVRKVWEEDLPSSTRVDPFSYMPRVLNPILIAPITLSEAFRRNTVTLLWCFHRVPMYRDN